MVIIVIIPSFDELIHVFEELISELLSGADVYSEVEFCFVMDAAKKTMQGVDHNFKIILIFIILLQ